MRSVQRGPAVGLVVQLVLLGALATTVGLSRAGWFVALGWAFATSVTLATGLARHGGVRLGPADRVTLVRAVLAGGVAGIAVAPTVRPGAVVALVTMSVVVLVLDGVDGWVARRTSTVSPLGARFDMEVDAFLILVLSAYVARSFGAWVLLIGVARYAFGAAGWAAPWLRGTLPPRYWRKVVAAVQGVTLTVTAAEVVPRPLAGAALVAALALLTESFGRDVWWLWRRRPAYPGTGRVRTVLAALVVWFALLAPNQLRLLSPATFVRLPVEGLALVGVLLVVPARARRPVAVLAGVVLGSVALLTILDMGFFVALGRPFSPVGDWSYIGSARGLLTDSIGRPAADAATVAVAAASLAVFLLVPLAVVRLSRLVDRHRTAAARAVIALVPVWVLAAATGVQVGPSLPVASSTATQRAARHVSDVRAAIRDDQVVAAAAVNDPFRGTPGGDLLGGLRGKDVIVVFVESYGRVALEDPAISPGVDAALKAGTSQLQDAGFSSRSAFLTSPTFGGISWLAHSTLQSGLWIDSQHRYNALVSTDRLTLSGAFNRAGWRTVGDVPSNRADWPEGRSFYGYDTIYDSRNLGYAGPGFSYATMPDQYILSAFQRLELGRPGHAPVMAEIDLVSSHLPWAPLPHLIDWGAVGNGASFDGMPAQGPSAEVVWRHTDGVRRAYGQSIEYSLNTLVSFVRTCHDDNLVLLVLGDHQPATVVSGVGASHDVPVTLIARDPAVLSRISGWGWQDGLLPGPEAPVWPMSDFRDRFLTAFAAPLGR